MKKNLLQFFVSAFLYFFATLTATTALVTPAHAMLRIEVCGGANDERACKPGIDEIANTGSGGSVDIGCSPGDPICTVKDQKIQVNSKSALPTPADWIPAVPPSVEPTPPSSISETAGVTSAHPNAGYPGEVYPGFPSACSLPVNAVYRDSAATSNLRIFSHHAISGYPAILNNSDNQGACGDGTYVSTKILGCPSGSSYTNPDQCTTAASCPAGYSVAGGGLCSLSNASIVMKPSDGVCTIKRDGNIFSGDSRDPDCSVNPGVAISSSVVTINPVSGSVENKKIEFQPDGSGKITSSVPNADGTTTERTVTFGSPDGTTGKSTVTGTGERIYKGTGDQKEDSIGEIPTDYNRETTQQQIKSGIDDLNASLDGTGVDATLDGPKSALDIAAADQIAGLESATSRTSSGLDFTFGFPSPGACSPLEFAIPGGRTLVIDWCPAQAPIKSIGNFIVALFTALYLFSLGTSIFSRG